MICELCETWYNVLIKKTQKNKVFFFFFFTNTFWFARVERNGEIKLKYYNQFLKKFDKFLFFFSQKKFK